MGAIIRVLFVLLFLASPCLGATYYIDPTCATPGDGTSSVCAGGATDPFDQWSDVTWAAGNTYSQKGGTTASETITVGASGTAGNVITINSYGTGQSIIDGSVAYSSWTPDDPIPGVWSTTATTNNVIYEDDVPLRYGSDTSCTGGNVFWTSGLKNYYKPTDAADPSTHVVKWTRLYGINIGVYDYITIDNLSIKRYGYGVYSDGTVDGDNNNYITVTNSTIDDCKQGINLFNHNSTSTSININNNAFSYCMNSIELGTRHADTNGDNGKYTNSDISYNTITNASEAKNSGGYPWRVKSSYHYSYWGDGEDMEGIGTQSINSSSIHHNTITGMSRGIVHYNGLYHTADSNNIYSNYVNVAQASLQMGSSSSATSFNNNAAYNNILVGGEKDDEYSGGYRVSLFLDGPTSGTNTNYIYNNTIISSGYVGIGAFVGGYQWNIKNNVIYGNNLTLLYWLVYFAAPVETVIDYNLYYPTQNDHKSTSQWNAGSGDKTFAQWQALGYDTHSPSPSDPLLVSASDFRLQPTSPAINTGATLGTPYNVDYAGTTRPFGAGYDIGALEWYFIGFTGSTTGSLR
jgi:hypothetical protein